MFFFLLDPNAMIQLPILTNPMTWLNLILGNTADILYWRTPVFSMSASFEFEIVVYSWPTVAVTFGGGISLEAQLHGGFDTYGLFKLWGGGVPWYTVFDGFYFSNRLNMDGSGGYDRGSIASDYGNNALTYDAQRATGGALIKMSIYLEVGLELSLTIVRAGAKGGIRLDCDLSFNDPLGDGKLRISQIVNIFAANNCENTFLQLWAATVTITIYVEVYIDVRLPWWVNVWSWRKEWVILTYAWSGKKLKPATTGQANAPKSIHTNPGPQCAKVLICL
jgi:hypothetical protein